LFLLIQVFILLPQGAASQSIRIADSLHEQQEFQPAIAAYDRYIQQRSGEINLDMGNAYLRRSVDYVHIGQYTKAVEGYMSALHIFEQLNNRERIGSTYSNLAYLYSIQQNSELTGKYLDKSMAIFRQLNDSARIAEIMNDQALLAYEQNNTTDAIKLHEAALKGYRQHMPASLISKHLYNLGSCYEKINTDSALNYYMAATKLALDEGDSSMLPAAYANIGDIYKQKGRFREALSYLNNSLQLNADYGDSADLGIIYHNLSDTYDSLGDFRKAYEYSVKEKQINEWLYNTEKSRIASELAEKYESDKKDQTIKTQQAENRVKSRNLLIALLGLLIVAMVAILAYYQFRQKKRANQVLQDTNLSMEKLNKELDQANQVKARLFSVISHDLRGPVSSLYAYLQMQQQAEAHQQTDPLSEYVKRQTGQLLEVLEELLLWSKAQMQQFSLKKEKFDLMILFREQAGIYHADLKSRHMELRQETSADCLVETDRNILAVILRNIIGNAVKHAPDGATIRVALQYPEQEIRISISNPTNISTYQEAPDTLNSHYSGMGHVLIRDFAGLIGGRFESAVQDGTHTCSVYLPRS